VRAIAPHCGLRSDSNLGGEVYERMLCERLPAHGVELDIGVVSSRAPDAAVVPGWRVTCVRPGRGVRWYVAPLPFVPFTVRRLRAGGADLLRGHSVRFTAPSLYAARALARAQVPIVLHHLHTDPGWERVEHGLLRRADGVVTISRASERQLLEAGVDPTRVFMVHSGVGAPTTHDPWKQAWPPGAALRLLMLGRLEDRKRPELAIRALAAVRSRGVDAALVVAGEGPLAPALNELARELGIATSMRMLGRVGEADKWRLYDGAHVLLFPSRLEGFGLVPAEAQMRGVPVVATRGTATDEIVQDGLSGRLVDSDPELFADAIAEVGDPLGRAALAARARAAGERFTWERCAAGTADAYRAIVARYRG
jgi:glycosyltransferase involved in cell wall biosynthesis